MKRGTQTSWWWGRDTTTYSPNQSRTECKNENNLLKQNRQLIQRQRKYLQRKRLEGKKKRRRHFSRIQTKMQTKKLTGLCHVPCSSVFPVSVLGSSNLFPGFKVKDYYIQYLFRLFLSDAHCSFLSKFYATYFLSSVLFTKHSLPSWYDTWLVPWTQFTLKFYQEWSFSHTALTIGPGPVFTLFQFLPAHPLSNFCCKTLPATSPVVIFYIHTNVSPGKSQLQFEDNSL